MSFGEDNVRIVELGGRKRMSDINESLDIIEETTDDIDKDKPKTAILDKILKSLVVAMFVAVILTFVLAQTGILKLDLPWYKYMPAPGNYYVQDLPGILDDETTKEIERFLYNQSQSKQLKFLFTSTVNADIDEDFLRQAMRGRVDLNEEHVILIYSSKPELLNVITRGETKSVVCVGSDLASLNDTIISNVLGHDVGSNVQLKQHVDHICILALGVLVAGGVVVLFAVSLKKKQ